MKMSRLTRIATNIRQHLLRLSRSFQARDLIILVPILWLLFTTLPYWNQAPANDPMVIYRESTRLYTAGLKNFMGMGYAVHPPLINLLISCFFFLFGKAPISYTLSGIFVYLCLLFASYFYLKKRVSWVSACAFILIFFTHPWILVNSVILSNDFLLTLLAFLLLIGILEDSLPIKTVSMGLLGIAKETGLLFILAGSAILLLDILRTWVLERKFPVRKVMRALLALLPGAIAWGIWQYLLRQYQQTEWRDFLFNPGGQSSFEIIYRNIIEGKLFNKHLFGNLLNLGVYYSQWLYTFIFALTVSCVASLTLLEKKRVFSPTTYLSAFFALTYLLLALSFPTWTVLRYGIPVLFFFLVILATSFQSLSISAVTVITALFVLINGVTLYYSVDPYMKKKFGDNIQIYGVDTYAVPFELNGPDRYNYNLAILRATKKQNQLLAFAYKNDIDVMVTNCVDLKLGEKVWSVSVNNEFYPSMHQKTQLDCINLWEITSRIDQLSDKNILLQRSDPKPTSKEAIELNKVVKSITLY